MQSAIRLANNPSNEQTTKRFVTLICTLGIGVSAQNKAIDWRALCVYVNRVLKTHIMLIYSPNDYSDVCLWHGSECLAVRVDKIC